MPDIAGVTLTGWQCPEPFRWHNDNSSGPGSRSTRNSSGCSRSPERTGCGCNSMQPRLTIQASPTCIVDTTSSAVQRRELRSAARGAARRFALLIKRLTLGAVHKPLENDRAILKARQRARRHRQIVPIDTTDRINRHTKTTSFPHSARTDSRPPQATYTANFSLLLALKTSLSTGRPA
jgi:hypothetical protein